MTLLLIGIAAGVATFIGGLLALKFKSHLHLILGFSAGAVIGVALFDLLPEMLELGSKFYDIGTLTALVALGFALYMVIDRVLLVSTSEGSGHRGHVGAGSLAIHSLLDGLAIGLAFQVSVELGAIVTIAVLVHDFSDGVNTVNMSLVGTGKDHIARRWLIVDALAPLAGIGLTFLFTIPQEFLSVILALFSGFFLYIGASELLPESHHRYPRIWTSAMTILGMAVIFAAVQFAGI